MPSPFPGMNPYLEQPRVWLGFHAQFIAAISQALNAQLGESYLALVEEQIYIHEVDENVVKIAGRADVGLAGAGDARDDCEAGGATGTLTMPLRVIVPFAEAEAPRSRRGAHARRVPQAHLSARARPAAPVGRRGLGRGDLGRKPMNRPVMRRRNLPT